MESARHHLIGLPDVSQPLLPGYRRSGFYNIVTQYPGLTDTQNVSTLGGTWIDTNPYPAGEGSAANPLSNTDIKTEVARALSLNPNWNPAGLGRTYFVYTEPGIESCIDPTASISNLGCTPGVTSAHSYCAYHSAFGTINAPITFANMPYGETWPGMCRGFGTSPNGDIAADGEISHVLSRTLRGRHRPAL